MENLRKFQNEALDALDILVRNFRIQSPELPKKPKQKEVIIYIYVSDFRDGMDFEAIFDAIHSFKKEGIRIKEYDKYDVQVEAYQNGARETSCAEVVVPINFERVYKKLCREYGHLSVEDQQTLPVKKGVEEKILTLMLNSIGDLWREPKATHCYPMGEKSDRHKIIRCLAKSKGSYRQTSEISMELEKDQQYIRTEIGKIRLKIKRFIKVDGKKVIDKGRKDSGYRINPLCKIIQIRP